MADQNPPSGGDADPVDSENVENTVKTVEDAAPEKKYIQATKDHFENDTPKERIKFYKKNDSGGVDTPPVEVPEPDIAYVDTYMVEASERGNNENNRGDDDSSVNDKEQQQKFADNVINTVMTASGTNTTIDALAQAVEDVKKNGKKGGGRRRTKRKDRKGSRKSRKGAKKGAKKSKKSSQSQNGGRRRSSKNRRKHSRRLKH
jgi:hypothetical protein